MLQTEDRRTAFHTTEPSDIPPVDCSVDAGVVIDINAELAHWEQCYRSCGFHRPDFAFKDYRPSLKFAYDAYLRYYGQSLQTLLPALHQKYVKVVPSGDRLEWDRMTQVVIAVWARLLRLGTRNAKPRAWHTSPGTELKTACRLRGTVAKLQNISTREPARPEEAMVPPAA